MQVINNKLCCDKKSFRRALNSSTHHFHVFSSMVYAAVRYFFLCISSVSSVYLVEKREKGEKERGNDDRDSAENESERKRQQ